MEDYKIAIIAIVLLLVIGITSYLREHVDIVEIKRVLRRIFSFIPSVAYDRPGSDPPTIYMKLDAFKKVYVVNPDAYRLYSITVERTYRGKDYIIGFKGLDFYRYKRWREKVFRSRTSDDYDETYREFMTMVVQKDINNLTKKAQKELDIRQEEMLRAMESSGELKL